MMLFILFWIFHLTILSKAGFMPTAADKVWWTLFTVFVIPLY